MAIATKSKLDLKDVFNGVSSLLYQSAPVSGSSIELSPEYDLPVTVDTLQVTEDDPTINHYKVIGLDGDWTSSAQLGDISVQFTVPTKNTDVLKLAYGSEAVTEGVSATLDGSTFEGVGLSLKKKKVTGTFVLLNEEGDQIMILSGVALWAKPAMDNTSTEPFALQFTGTIETGEGANFHFLKKKVATT